MLNKHRPTRRIAFYPSSAVAVVDSQFPRAVAGEDFERFSRATRRQAEAWFRRHEQLISGEGIAMHDARLILWSVTSADLGRPLYPQEERLLSDLLQQMWSTRPAESAVPEIPSFLVREPLTA